MDEKEQNEKKLKPLWQEVFPIFFCTCFLFVAIDHPGEVSLKNLPNLIVYFFVVLLTAFMLRGILYAIDTCFLDRVETWISKKLGTTSRWKKAVGSLIKLMILFGIMFVICGLTQPASA